MRYELAINGRTRLVSIERRDGAYAVTIDGRTWHVDAAAADPQTFSLILGGAGESALAAQSFELSIAPDGEDGQLQVRVGPTPVVVRLRGAERYGRRREGATGGSGPQRVTAPMPGKIVRVLVQPGETVHARQGLVVVEAMKMENELRAGREGRIAAVHAQQGQLVDAGALLVLVE